jgi:hypothetical protein
MSSKADDATTTASDEPTPRQRWGQWLNAQMEAHALTVSEFVRLLDNPSYDSAQVAKWRGGNSGASTKAAVRIARVLDLAPSEVLRAAGHDAVADLVEEVSSGAPPAKPVSDSVAARVEELTEGLQPTDAVRLKREAIADVGRIFELLEFRAAKLRHSERNDGPDAGAS